MEACPIESGWLITGMEWDGVIVTDAIRILRRQEIPKDCKVIYATFLCDYQPQK